MSHICTEGGQWCQGQGESLGTYKELIFLFRLQFDFVSGPVHGIHDGPSHKDGIQGSNW